MSTADQDRFMKNQFGYLPSNARLCPRVVTGKRCLVNGRSDKSCPCEIYMPVPLDHTRIWRTQDGRHALTAEPYGIDCERFAVFIQDMARLGLCVCVQAHSPWYPGKTVLIHITRAHGADGQRKRRSH